MTSKILMHMETLGLALPPVSAPAGSYVPAVQAGDLLMISGQLPMINGALLHPGALGEDVTVEQGQEAAALCTLHALAQAAEALESDLDRILRVVRLGVFVNAVPGFTQHPQVANGASELMVQIFGEKGKHVRAAVGCGSLPLGACVEVEAAFEVKAAG